MGYKKYLVGLGLGSMLILSACNTEDVEDNSEEETVEENVEVDESKEQKNKEVDEYKEKVDENKNDEEDNQETEEDESELGFNHTPNEAIDFAKENFNGELTQLNIEMEDDEWEYKVELENEDEGYEVELSVNMLSILDEDIEDGGDSEDTFNYEDLIPYDEAIQTAKNEGGGEFKEFQLSKDDNLIKYEVKLVNDVEVEINAETGEVIGVD